MSVIAAKWTIAQNHQMISAGIWENRRVKSLKNVETKTKIYAGVGIPEYWVVNLNKRQLIVFRDPQDGDYASKFTLTGGTANPIAFPDVSVSVNAIVSN
ncbi:protein of unknown function DUF820 [Oscillatoria nigro-viridis PCC 7112]|uniref:Putative restriction endonuclease domain-containing protein n=1 Tax=Phormidium nigroviride PCC 7112 TaxID=179408 RepID=K9VFR5_9CYAN|nr:Uma2 family endonuclease [Oscillatoria nigro-viridis]AFZ06796.1 protein of unknown function DUF820 [Oscillatoria nigro-viridis PCC 7112]